MIGAMFIAFYCVLIAWVCLSYVITDRNQSPWKLVLSGVGAVVMSIHAAVPFL